MGTQLTGALVGAGFAFLSGGALWFAMKRLVPGGVRVSPEHEIEGLDLAECGVEAYGTELQGVSDVPRPAAPARVAYPLMTPQPDPAE